MVTSLDHRRSSNPNTVSLDPAIVLPLWQRTAESFYHANVAQKARYTSAYIAMLVGYTIKLVAIIVLYIYMYRENKARDAAGLTDEKTAVEAGMHDVTELDNKGFRYSL